MAIEKQLAELQLLADRARNVLRDARKAKWHEDTRTQLAQIEAEMSRLKAREAKPVAPVAPSPRGGEGRGEGIDQLTVVG